MQETTLTRRRLDDDLADAVDKTARTHMDLRNASPEARRCAGLTIYLGPLRLLFNCRPSELERLYSALQDAERRSGSDFETEPTAGELARTTIALQPREALVEPLRLAPGELADLRDRQVLDTEEPLGVPVRGALAAEVERAIAWLLVQAGLPPGACEGVAA